MIKVYATYSGGEYNLSITGHAGYNPGNDIVCAGASAISYTLLGMLDHLGVEYDSIEEPGDMRVVLSSKRIDVRKAFQMAIIGLAQIAKAYSRYMSVEQDGIL
jgi:uncharacterized protein YsxB (DUF464 family)